MLAAVWERGLALVPVPLQVPEPAPGSDLAPARQEKQGQKDPAAEQELEQVLGLGLDQVLEPNL